MKNTKSFLGSGSKVAAILMVLFFVSLVQVCAESKKTMSPEEAFKKRMEVVDLAQELIGSPYKYGATGPKSFDCSGFVYYTARTSAKVQLPRSSSAIYNFCNIIDNEDREIGDLLFFKTTSSGEISHVGIYIGNNQFVSAISDGSNTGVQVRSLTDKYWKPKYCATGQILPSIKGMNFSDDYPSFEITPVTEPEPKQSVGAKGPKKDDPKSKNKTIPEPKAPKTPVAAGPASPKAPATTVKTSSSGSRSSGGSTKDRNYTVVTGNQEAKSCLGACFSSLLESFIDTFCCR